MALKTLHATTAVLAVAALAAAPAAARDKAEAKLTKCEASYGTIAITDGDTQGWTKFKLSSPREMLGALVRQSGCFELHNPASGAPADFLLSAIAGSQEEVDQGMNIAKGALTEGLVRSGAAGAVLSKVPVGGALIGMFGGLGGKKKTVSAGLRIMSPATGQTLIAGSGKSQKSMIKIMGASDWMAASQGSMGQYATSSDGKLLTTAFLEAYNNLVGQAGALAAAKPAAVAAQPKQADYVVAVATKMWPEPSKAGTPVRELRADTKLTPTGAREGLFVKVSDSYGTSGWVSVEDLR